MNELIPTRATLLERLKDWQDQSSWQEFFDTYWKLIFSFAVKSGLTEAEAHDVVQDTMVAVAKRMPTFHYDPALGSFKYWLLQLTRWRVTDQFRKRGRIAPESVSADDPEADVALLDNMEDPTSEILDKLWEAEWEEKLLDAAKARVKRRVEPRLFQIYDLSVRKEWPPAKVAAALEVPVGQVYLAKHRVGELIKEELKRIEKSDF